MGTLSNSVGLRLGYNRAWLVKAYAFRRYLPLKENTRLFHRFFEKKFWRRRVQKAGILYSHSFARTTSIFEVFLYDSRLEIILFRLYKRLRRKQFRFRSYFRYKKYIKRRFIMPSWKVFFHYAVNRQIRFFSYINKNLIRGYRYLRRFVFFKIRKPVLHYYLSYALKAFAYARNFINDQCLLRITPLSSSTLTTKALVLFALRKLRSKNSLGSIFWPLIKGFSSIALGIRVYCAGRFTRKQRATFKVFRAGKVPLNTFSTPIDYCSGHIPLKYGVGNVRIWLTHHPFIVK